MENGCQQVLWLYGKDNQITEVGTMNLFLYWINEDGGNCSSGVLTADAVKSAGGGDIEGSAGLGTIVAAVETASGLVFILVSAVWLEKLETDFKLSCCTYGSACKSPGCSCRGPEFCSVQPHCGSQLSVTLISGDPALFWTPRVLHPCTHTQCIAQDNLEVIIPQGLALKR